MIKNKVRLPTYFERKIEAEKKPKILIFSGSPRSSKNCAAQESKTIQLAKIALDAIKNDANVELINLANEDEKVVILPCNGCISTAGGYQCHFPCSCYSKAKKDDPIKDMMYEFDIYQKMLDCDGFMIFSPIHWYGTSTAIKAMFDRLVCMSVTLPAEFAMKEMGKDPKKTIPASESGIYDDKLKNWYEGKFAAFFVHGDEGGDDFDRIKKPKSFDEKYHKKLNDPITCISPIMATCKYSGINVPDDLVYGSILSRGEPYSEANEKFKEDMESTKKEAANLAKRLINYII